MGQRFVAALIGLVVGGLLAWVKAALAIREKVNEELRSRRVAAYPPIYLKGANIGVGSPLREG